MSGLRTGVVLPGAAADTVVRAAGLAEQWNVDALWIGDPAGTEANADDTYVMVAAAAAAAATTWVRIGVILSGRGSAPPLRVAEDIGVVDQIANGRLSVVFRPPADGDSAAWRADVERIAGAHRSWDLGGGRTMPVTPPPAQPAVPVGVLDPVARVTRSLSGPGPALLIVQWPEAATPRPPAELLALKNTADGTGAGEAVLVVDPAGDLDAAFAVTGTVVAPCLRAADHEVEILARDATRWLQDCSALHSPPD